jgi:hypothetical protein
MPLLNIGTAAITESDRAANRVFPVTVKLTQEEHRRVTEHANRLGQPRSEWMRDMILRGLHSEPSRDPSLAEIIGVRLLLVNVLRPLAAGQKVPVETFDKLLDQISTAKQELAAEVGAAKEK